MKIDKSKLMKRAWEIAVVAVCDFGGRTGEYFSESLKQAWNEAKSESQIDIARLVELGNEWQAHGHHRIYFNNISQYFNSICRKPYQREVNGVQCNREELESKVNAKIWFDVKTGEFDGRSIHFTEHDLEIVKRNILAA